MRMNHDALKRLRAEYLEMPGLRLTAVQVQRLCGIERVLCQSVLDALVDTQFLCMTPNGNYARLTDGEIVLRPRAAKVNLLGAAKRPAKKPSWLPRAAKGRNALIGIGVALVAGTVTAVARKTHRTGT